MKNWWYIRGILLLFTIACMGTIAHGFKDEAGKIINNLKVGNWIEKIEAAKKLSMMTGIKVEKKLQPLFHALDEEIRIKTSDQKPSGSYKTISVHLKDQYVFAIANAGDENPAFIISQLNKAKGEFKDRLILSLGLLKSQNVNIKHRIIQLAQKSQDGYIRALAMRVLGEWEDVALIPLLTNGLKDNFKVNVKTDLVTPNTYKGEDGYYNPHSALMNRQNLEFRIFKNY
ncbi:MAG TPA: HEAT repeat domain-containing protein [Nitrospirae bacterium]|nr:hypothetical protein BMS3Abin06_02677 [bacterium BMS3Abin06]HDH13070.1 HEAT repeat domain-containing protein [Nitrospirota bacterium]HDZ02910.1 HEAT repeat domain-containing protein [Nitrospirota bacterium]